MGAAPAFSVIGVSSTAAGAGDTEDARYNTALQYRLDIGQFRLATLHQFGGYEQGNGSNGAYEAQVGADFAGFSFDATYARVKDAVSLSNYAGSPLPAGVSDISPFRTPAILIGQASRRSEAARSFLAL
jgi:hypothetical protein